MKVTLHQRQKANKISLYLEYYSNGKRQYEYLNLYLTPDPEKGSLTKHQKDENKKDPCFSRNHQVVSAFCFCQSFYFIQSKKLPYRLALGNPSTVSAGLRLIMPSFS